MVLQFEEREIYWHEDSTECAGDHGGIRRR